MRGALLILALACLILHSNSKKIMCSSNQTLNETCYFVPETTASGCQYSWSNSTDFVFATRGAKLDELVASSNISTLVTYTCHREIKYFLSCLSEREATSGTCIINCTTTDHQKATDPVAESPHGPVQWMACLSVFAALLLLLIAGILCYIFKDKLCRGRGHSYSPTTGNNLDEVWTQCNGAERSDNV